MEIAFDIAPGHFGNLSAEQEDALDEFKTKMEEMREEKEEYVD